MGTIAQKGTYHGIRYADLQSKGVRCWFASEDMKIGDRLRPRITVKLTLIGRPALEAVQTRPTYVSFRMQGKAPGPLPKGLPPVPDQQPITWLVVIALRQWNRAKESLAAHPDDTLIIEGHPVVAGEGTHVLLAQNCTSKVQQRAKKQAPHSHEAETPH
jgi:hypothetical protein